VKLTIALLMLLAGGAASPSRADDKPPDYDKLRANCHEALIIEVTGQIITTDKEKSHYYVTAIVRKVERTNSKLETGTTITISYEVKKDAKVGPGTVPKLDNNTLYPAFLDRIDAKTKFQPAADGMSFVMSPVAK
jgi:hypothetical protein